MREKTPPLEVIAEAESSGESRAQRRNVKGTFRGEAKGVGNFVSNWPLVEKSTKEFQKLEEESRWGQKKGEEL